MVLNEMADDPVGEGGSVTALLKNFNVETDIHYVFESYRQIYTFSQY